MVSPDPLHGRSGRQHAHLSELPFVTVMVVAVLVLLIGLGGRGPGGGVEGDSDGQLAAGATERVGGNGVATAGSDAVLESPTLASSSRAGEPGTGRADEALGSVGSPTRALPVSLGGAVDEAVREAIQHWSRTTLDPGAGVLPTEEGSFRAGKRHGVWTSRRRDGSLLERGAYVDGLKNGLWVMFSSTGGVLEETRFSDGAMQGIWRSYDEGGAVLEEGQHQANLRTGEWVVRYSHGGIKERGTYLNGLREGSWEFYDDLGSPTLRTGTYRAGIKIL